MTREKKTYSVSALAREAGIGDRKTWRKIVEKDRYSKKFTITNINEKMVRVETELNKIELVAVYNDYLEYFIKKIHRKLMLANRRIQKKSDS